VFEVRDLPSELWPLAIHWIGGHVWTLARHRRRPRRLIADEAATLLAHPSGGAFLAELARRARKHYLGLVTIVQKVGDLTGSEHGDTILTNAAMKLLLKQRSDTIAAADGRFRLTGEERTWLLGAGKGDGLLLVDNQRHQIRILASRAEHRLITTNLRELAELEAQLATDGLAAAVSPRTGAAGARNGRAQAGW
jgi:type IV secretory pathway VirB4 component